MSKKKIILIVLYILLAVAVIAMIGQAVTEKKFDTDTLTRGGILFVSCVLGIVKISTMERSDSPNSEFYESQYEKELKYAFVEPERKHLRKKLIKAIAKYNKNNYKGAVETLKSLLPECQTNGDHVTVRLFLALCFTEAGRPDVAIELYHDIIRNDTTNSTVWSNLGFLYKSQGENQKAIECYGYALENDPNNPFAHNNLGMSYFAVGEYEKAIECCKKALEIKGNLHQAASNICLAYCALKDEENCEKYFKIAVTLGYDASRLQNALESLRAGNFTTQNAISDLPDDIGKSVREFELTTALPYLRVSIPSNAGSSRFGGKPIGDPPKDANGKPMRLLAAIYCSELLGLPDFPDHGIIQFFIAENEIYGADIENPNNSENFRVTYTEDENQGTDEKYFKHEASDIFPLHGCYRLKFEPAKMSMTDADYRFREQLDKFLIHNGAPDCDHMDENHFEAISERFHSEGHKIGGYPHFTQSDPRESAPELQKYDTLLLQIDSNDLPDGTPLVTIGDGGVLNFFISRAALLSRNFSDIMYTWDCY